VQVNRLNSWALHRNLFCTKTKNLHKNRHERIFHFVAKPRFILQAVTPASHAAAVINLLELDPITWVLASVAYLREDGLAAIEASIRPIADRVTVFVGIRNDLTSIQAVKRFLALNVQLYAVDTATRQSIYHPKLYVVSNDAQARVVVGSANLTFGGMYNNIEVSAMMEMDRTNADDDKFLNDVTRAFDDLVKNHPDHVFKIKDIAHADELFREGRLADEKVIPPPSTGSTVKSGSRDSLGPMKLNLKPKPKVILPPPTGRGIVVVVPPALPPGPAVSHLVWQSNALTERDLNVPSGGNTHKTGSMGFKKGAWIMGDHRHYFRDEVFSGLTWTPKTPGSKTEKAKARFELIIKSINYGIFELDLSHNTDTTSRSYKQGNMMTDIKWGPVKDYVSKRDLLERTLSLYRKDTNPPEFLIEID